MEKCYFFDKGYCKLKSQCLKKHPTADCKGQCEDKKLCSSRHRVECKNGNKCIFKGSRSCEFLHIEKSLGNENNLEDIENSFGKIQAMVKGIEDKIVIINTTITQTQTRLSAMEKDVYKHNQMENIIRQLEVDNKEMKTKLDKAMSEKFEELDSQIIILENKINKELTEHIKGNPKVKGHTNSKLNEFKCFICNKEFRNETTLGNHDKKFHLEKGASFFKCDNCDETFWEKLQLGQHITKEHTSCSLCKKVYPDSTSLNYHVTAVHNKLKMKHDIERESSLRIHKVKRFNSRV